MFVIHASASEKQRGLVYAVTSSICVLDGNLIGAEFKTIGGYGFMTAVFVMPANTVADDVVRELPATFQEQANELGLVDSQSFVAPLNDDSTSLDTDQFVHVVRSSKVSYTDMVAQVTCGSARHDVPGVLNKIAGWLFRQGANILDLSAVVHAGDPAEDGELEPTCEVVVDVEVLSDGSGVLAIQNAFSAAFDHFIEADADLWWASDRLVWGVQIPVRR